MPDFELSDQSGEPFRLGERLAEGAVVLVFYRGDWWPYCNGQLVELAGAYDDFRAAGAELAGVSVDPPAASAALTEKLALPFPLLSDPDGEGAIKRFGLWDERERGGLSQIAAIAIRPDRLEALRFDGADYADRPRTEDVLEAVRPLGLIPLEPRSGVYTHVAPQASSDAESLTALTLYMRGARGASKALYERTGDEHAGRVWRMAARYYDLLKAEQSRS